MDLDLPELDGVTVTRLLRQHRELDGVPVVAVTAYDKAYPRAESFAEGAAEYFIKPVDPGALGEAVARLLRVS